MTRTKYRPPLISRGNRLLPPPFRKDLRDFILLEARAPGRTCRLRNTGPYLAAARLRLLTKADRHRQCKTLWDYPSLRACHKQPPCRRCGKTGYAPDNCIAPEQCVNCIGPHRANFHKCPARPRKAHGVFRRLIKE
uniref:CCHC-type domain-containing protein n=1 Tax=Fusarium oxysporum (strain Fo5176) TaxID=660025 RepID=A0A0D2YDR8_FUSOF